MASPEQIWEDPKTKEGWRTSHEEELKIGIIGSPHKVDSIRCRVVDNFRTGYYIQLSDLESVDLSGNISSVVIKIPRETGREIMRKLEVLLEKRKEVLAVTNG